jgi:hypothetical protein
MKRANQTLQATAATPRSRSFMKKSNIIISSHGRFRRLCLRGCLKNPERGWVVFDQPQRIPNLPPNQLHTPPCGWSATQPRSFFRQALS